ncbi:efflux transporter outer membrane subunit [Novosphingobium sp.]|uniref:efflux transporter outer membrane subunit n=1 Tax=Novosphingobium sp. TaxID=1874826 RepID=UPI0025D7744C|nr:efflux transporter outer membrane subunit [Novosphingobium sp.]
MNRALLIAATLASALAGCAAPHTPLPEAARVVAPEAWRTDLAGVAPMDAQWWRTFGDPQLAALVERALANNTDIAIAAARVREARAQTTAARAALLPTLDAGLGASEARTINPFGMPSTSTSAQPTVQAAYEVDLFGRIADQVSAARNAYLASAAARDAASLSVAGATASGYVTLLALDARRLVVNQTIADRASALKLAQSRARAGYTSDLELRQAQAEYQGTALILPQVDLAIARAEQALRLLSGDVPGPIARGTLAGLANPALPAEGLPSELLRRRPDVAQAELSLAATDASLSVARKQFLPSLRLAASAGAVFNTLLPDPISIWSIGGSVLAPLFQGGRLRAGVEGAAARRDQAAFAYRKAALTAFRETDDTLVTIARLADQRRALEAQRIAVASALKHATNRYQAGYSGYLEQLDAQRSLLAIDLSLVQLRADQTNAVVALYQALGGGWNGVAEAQR